MEEVHEAAKGVLVGHCTVDGPRLRREIEAKAGPVEVLSVNEACDLDAVCAQGECLLLVNREPVGFAEPGVDLIRYVRRRHPGHHVMLVSDLPDAQTRAVEAGALPGFGKADMGSPKLIEAVRRGLAQSEHGRDARP
jgi:hypothetical protein